MDRKDNKKQYIYIYNINIIDPISLLEIGTRPFTAYPRSNISMGFWKFEKVFPREKEGLSIRNAPRAGLFQLGQRFGKISESQVIFLLTIGDINEDMVCKSNANLFL